MPVRKSLGWAFFLTFSCVCIFTGIAVFQVFQIQQGILERKELILDEKSMLQFAPFTHREAVVYYGCYVAMAGLPILCLYLGILASSRVFYYWKLQKPLRELSDGIEKIAMDDLDFSIYYSSDDELGRLCGSMERMRRELCRSKEKNWELLQQRRLLYASVAHDLRTPITVLKGYLDYLKEDAGEGKVSDDEISMAICGMDEAVGRLEQYVGCVRDIDRLDGLRVQKQNENVAMVLQELKRDICSLRTGKRIEVSSNLPQAEICIDKQLVFRLIENLVQNAVRYATDKVSVELCLENGFLMVCVKDDGKGFGTKGLRQAAEWFFTTEGSGHFGIGLNICNMICEKLDGRLSIVNGEAGGGCVTAAVKI